jgi:hypothetical protein
MFQLIYSSAARVPFTRADIENVLTVSREKNPLHGITGVLLYKSGSIIQVLEGEEEAVRRLYGLIRNDPRHREVTTIYTRMLDEREFPDWTMGFNCVEFEMQRTPVGFNPVFHRRAVVDQAVGRGASLVRTFVATTR